MKNIEAYKKQLITTGVSFGIDINTNRIVKCGDLACMYCLFSKEEPNCGCGVKAMKWLLSERKEPILDKAERKYINAVIAPFKDKVRYLVKRFDDEYEYLVIHYDNFDGDDNDSCLLFPSFNKGSMYKGMKINKEYTLKELNL